MNAKDIFYITVLITYLCFFVIMISWAICTKIKKKNSLKFMQQKIDNKLKKGNSISSKDVYIFGKRYGLSNEESRNVIYKLYCDEEVKNYSIVLNELVKDLEVEEPFDFLPDEVKPSLSRISKILADSDEYNDKYVLPPIINVLNKYIEIKTEKEQLNKKTYRAYVVSIISFIIGIISFFITLTAPPMPTATDIAKEISSITLN